MTIESNPKRIATGLTFQKQIELNSLLPEVKILILENCDLAALGALSRLDKDWNKIINLDIWKKIVYKELAFGNDKWMNYYNSDEIEKTDKDFESLNIENLLEECRNLKNLCPHEKIQDLLQLTWIPKLIDKELNVDTFGKVILKSFFQNSIDGYQSSDYDPNLFNYLSKKQIQSHCWMIVVNKRFGKAAIKDEMRCDHVCQHVSTAGVLDYEICGVTELIITLFVRCIQKKQTLLKTSSDFILCKEFYHDQRIIVGMKNSLTIVSLPKADAECENYEGNDIISLAVMSLLEPVKKKP